MKINEKYYVVSRPRIASGAHHCGFTLVELLVVLVLIALITAIAAPNIRSVYKNFQQDIVREEIEKELKGLSFRAYLAGQSLKLDKITLPEGFSSSDDSEVTIRADGYCEGGKVLIESEDEKFTYFLNPPLCRPERLEAENDA